MRSELKKTGTEDLLRDLASRCGIDLIGIADVNFFSSFGETVCAFHGSAPLAFSKGDITDRFDISGEWEEAQGIISFGLSYASSDTGEKKPGTVRISRSSWGEDYHEVLKRKACALMEEFTKSVPCAWKVFVDTGKLSDRALAYAAGLGFYGKNGFIISQEYGSFVFLGHILTNVPLEPDASPMDCLCGDCDRCIRACPRGALGKRRWVDWENCVSYLSQKGKEYGETDYIYGCDICQNVCSFNSDVPSDLHAEFFFPEDLRYPDPQTVAEMDGETFRRLYGGSALAWRGAGTLRKNARRFLNRKIYE